MEAGPIRIVVAEGGGHYCDECHACITGDDADRSMRAADRLLDGVCECCGIVIDHGNPPAD